MKTANQKLTPKELALARNEKSITDSINELITGIQELRDITTPREQRNGT